MTKRRGNHEGSIIQRSTGSWRAQLVIHGRRLNFSAKTRLECQEWLLIKNLEIRTQSKFQKPDQSLSQYLLDWLTSRQVALREKTYFQYTAISRNYILPALGEKRLIDLNLNEIEHFYQSLLSTGIGLRMIRYIHAVLHCALEKAVKLNLIDRNPAHGANLPALRNIEMKTLDEQQVSRFLVAAIESRHRSLYHLAIVTGMREGEILGLRWADVDWQTGTLFVRRQVQSIPHHGIIFTEPKTKAGIRAIKIGEGTLQILREQRERIRMEKQFLGIEWQENDLIFPNKVGAPLDVSNLRKDYREILQRAGLNPIRFHDLRHTAASLMLNHGVPVIVVSKRLGHSKPSITMDIYGHLMTEMQNEAARLIDEMIIPTKVVIPTNTEAIPKPEPSTRLNS